MSQSRESHRSRRRLIAAAILVFTAVVIVYVEREPVLTAAGRWLDVSEPLAEPVDDVLVLGGDASTRPFVAAAIFRAGLARRILVPQVEHSSDVRDGIIPPHHEIIRRALLKSSVDSEAIEFLPSLVNSTDREALALAEYLNRHPDHRVAVVTSDFHTRRTQLLLSRSCGSFAENIHIVGAPTDGFGSSNWWRFETGFVLYVNEYLKLAKTMVSRTSTKAAGR